MAPFLQCQDCGWVELYRTSVLTQHDPCPKCGGHVTLEDVEHDEPDDDGRGFDDEDDEDADYQ